MTVWVVRDGLLVPKGPTGFTRARSDLPAPMLSRMEPFESPVTGKEISNWRDRDRDMAAVGAVDPRDLPPPEKMRRGRAVQKREAADARKRKPDDAA